MEEEEEETEREIMERLQGIWWSVSGSGDDESFECGSHEFSTGVEELRRSIFHGSIDLVLVFPKLFRVRDRGERERRDREERETIRK